MIKAYANKFLNVLPYNLGRSIRNALPDRIINGKSFEHYIEKINAAEKWTIDEKKEFVIKKFNKLLFYAYNNIPFYRNFYHENDFKPQTVQSLEDIKQIPVVKKSDFQKIDLYRRKGKKIKSLLSNTGGTTGQPLQFFLDKNIFSGKETSHMEKIWVSAGHKNNHIRLRFRGRNIGQHMYEYSTISKEIQLNMYLEPKNVAHSLMKHRCFKDIKTLHGYPGLIYETTRDWEKHCPEIIEKLNKQVVCILLSSELPIKSQRGYIETIYNAPSMSWYGHSEMAILAYEKSEQYLYEPFVTYGYSESQCAPEGNHLVATAWDNYSHPFIRYDTEDLIEPQAIDDFMLAFKIKEGRTSDIIFDKFQRKISLTGLIFGQHHEILNHVDFIQISQDEIGSATIHLATRNQSLPENYKELFQTNNIAIDFKFDIRSKPYRSKNGKTPLLIKATEL